MILSSNRLYILYSSIFFMFIILIFRLIYLQIISRDQLVNEGNKRSLRIQSISESRGMITDRMGRLLAISIPVNSVWMDPKKINECGGVCSNIVNWIELSNILHISLERLLFFIHSYNTEHFIYLSRQIDPIIAKNISRLKLPGIYLGQESKRYYPSGSSTAHVVGITNIDNQGIEGIEKSFNSWLSGCPKTKIIRQDRLGRVVEDIKWLNLGQSSKNIMLSIDEHLQNLAYRELKHAVNINKAESGSIVLIDINTGEILIMVNSPSYDPNNCSQIINKSIMRNRAITDSFEPGSTIKPIVIMTALKSKLIEKDTVLNTLPYMINGHQIKDVSVHNTLTVSEVLKRSSNVGVSKLALAMSPTVLVNAYLSFGIGSLTNIGLIGENKGKIYSYRQYYSDIARAALSYGYGLMITPLQLAKVYATIGAMGVSRPLSIIKVDHPSSTQLSSENQFFSKSLVRTVIDMMTTITVSNNSCHQAAIHGYRVAVKTGTIKKVGSHGKYINQYIACTAGFAPVNNPRFALVVIINDPKNGHYYGGMVSSPVFKLVMSSVLKIMNVEPDF